MSIKKITALTLSAVLLMGSVLMSGCKYSVYVKDGDTLESADITKGETDFDIPISLPPETERKPENTEAPEYFKITQTGNTYGYRLFSKDGNIAAEDAGLYERPEIYETENLVFRVTVDGVTYYYDYATGIFSEDYYEVFDECGSLLIRAENNVLVVCSIFDDEYYTEISGFTYPLYTNEGSPFVSCSFIENGSAVNVVYLSWDYALNEPAMRTECFNLASNTKYVIISDWASALETITKDEQDTMESFLLMYMGTYDYNTGCSFAYSVSCSVVINGTKYYHCKAYYVMVGDDGTEELVPAAEFMMSEYRNERYDCRETDGEMKVYTENNMI